MALHVRLAGVADHDPWDTFVLDHPHGTPFHLTAWKQSIEQTFGYSPLYLLAEDAGGIRGLLPLFLVENFLVKKALISTPFAVYGGILADSEAAREAIGFYVDRLAHSLGATYVELRNTCSAQCAGLPQISRYATFLSSTDPDEDSLRRSLPKKTRNTVRKALKQGSRCDGPRASIPSPICTPATFAVWARRAFRGVISPICRRPSARWSTSEKFFITRELSPRA